MIRDHKVALVDTIWSPFAGDFLENLRKEIDLNDIDDVIANHAESDHSGALAALMAAIPGKPIYCTVNAVKSLKGHYHQNCNFQVVKTGDRLNLGSSELIFVEAPCCTGPTA